MHRKDFEWSSCKALTRKLCNEGRRTVKKLERTIQNESSKELSDKEQREMSSKEN